MVLTEWNPRTGHTIGCACAECWKWFETDMPHMDFIGQRADKIKVVEIIPGEESKADGAFVKAGSAKRVEEYTITCNECGGDGYYDQRGEVICEGCGMVLAGDDHDPVVPFNFGESQNMSSGRGVESEDESDATTTGHFNPSV